MSTYYWDEKSLVRRKGAVVAVTRRGNDGSGWHDGNKEFHPHESISGERRSRQIARRHWVRKELFSLYSSGGYWDGFTIKPPGKEECHLKKLVSG